MAHVEAVAVESACDTFTLRGENNFQGFEPLELCRGSSESGGLQRRPGVSKTTLRSHSEGSRALISATACGGAAVWHNSRGTLPSEKATIFKDVWTFAENG